MAALHPARPRDGLPLERLQAPPGGSRGRRAGAVAGAVLCGAVLGISMADIGAAILRTLLLLVILASTAIAVKNRRH